MLHKALGDAAKWHMVIRNVTDAVTAPKVPRRPVQPPIVEHVQRVLGSAKDAGIHPEIYTAIMTGLRPSELLALRWRDLDLEAGMARVVQAVRRVTGEGLVFQETKSHRSTRAIALPPSLAQVLRRHRARQAEHRLLVGPSWQDVDLILPNDVGDPRDPARLLRRFQNALAAAALPRMRLYDLRHWSVSLLLMDGVPLSVVSEAAGHADAGFTNNVYGHIALEAQREAALRLERRLASDAG